MKLNSSDWLAIQFALDGEIKRMKDFENSIHECVVSSAKDNIKRYEAVLKKIKEMGLYHD